MKKLGKFGALLLFVAGLIFASCSSSGGSSGSSAESHEIDSSLAPVEKGWFRINTLAKNADNVWIWNDFAESAKDIGSWDGANSGYRAKTGTNGDFIYFDIPLAENPESLGFIVRSGTSKVSGGNDILYYFPQKYTEIFLKSGSGTVYVDKDCSEEPSGLINATIDGENIITLNVSGNVNLSTETVTIKSEEINLSVKEISGNKVSVTESLKEKSSVVVEYTDDKGTDIRYAFYSASLIDDWFAITDDTIKNLGYKDGIFTTWAPLASSVKVILFEKAENAVNGSENYKEAGELSLVRQSNGTWKNSESASATVGSNKYYKYRIINNGITKDVCDIWNKIASKDSVASAIEAMPSWTEENSYTNPFTGDAYSGAIIYEMHITDWSQALRASVQEDKPGTFAEIAEGLGSEKDLAKHLKDLGVTHVQILPMFEYAVTTKRSKNNTVVEENDNAYNWGYNPYNYNTPESRYASLTDSSDGTEAVTALRSMIKAFHDAGLSVIMDVVYNHTNGTGDGSIYDMTVPKYFYRTSGTNYVDNSGCGNTLDTTHAVVEKFIIDSMKHWMEDYHVNGFRFDLMGCLTSDTMEKIYNELYSIDLKVMIYGEPWTGSGSVPNGATAAAKTSSGIGYGAFDDDFRNAIKGGEFSGFELGHVQGTFNDEDIIKGLCGKSTTRNKTDFPALSLHYAECHDNYTLFDKLIYSTRGSLSGDFAKDFKDIYENAMKNDKTVKDIKAQDTLAGAFVILSQGTPFINGGQEFLRSKQGDPDSYAADTKGGVFWENIDEVNAIKLSDATKYSDVYEVYKALISIRKQNFDVFGKSTTATAETVKKGVTKYIPAKDGNFCVYFNATTSTETITDTTYTKKMLETKEGSLLSGETFDGSLAPKSFVILSKN